MSLVQDLLFVAFVKLLPFEGKFVILAFIIELAHIFRQIVWKTVVTVLFQPFRAITVLGVINSPQSVT